MRQSFCVRFKKKFHLQSNSTKSKIEMRWLSWILGYTSSHTGEVVMLVFFFFCFEFCVYVSLPRRHMYTWLVPRGFPVLLAGTTEGDMNNSRLNGARCSPEPQRTGWCTSELQGTPQQRDAITIDGFIGGLTKLVRSPPHRRLTYTRECWLSWEAAHHSGDVRAIYGGYPTCRVSCTNEITSVPSS
jgi:hypothetical protein